MDNPILKGYTHKYQPLVISKSKLNSAVILITSILGIGVICLFSSCAVFQARAEVVDLGIIKHIESKGNPLAVSRTGAIGLYQIMPCVLAEYNKYNKVNLHRIDLFNPLVNEQIAKWYLTKRIPQMLAHFKLEVNTRNCIIAYNAGVRAVVKGYLPKETKNYLKKYARLT